MFFKARENSLETSSLLEASGWMEFLVLHVGSHKLMSSLTLMQMVKRMVNEVEKFEKEDKEKREAIDTKNQADSVVYQTKKQLKELGEKVPATVKEMVEEKLGLLKEAKSGGSTQTIIDAMAALN
ncbi:stromal 70 kDa heat shock-related protein, chloroplastic-like [Lactuca sativa]|uniref:stromal 70 kDa heat shock-related protein, chloroplastic-like n=1 Tax=Lactuca sativa TaxID=4236 RepID=UPI0022AF8D65|nr:stromal 70 kDa heat shock-related protein, chloroplastic-like [Lactuca sativa]